MSISANYQYNIKTEVSESSINAATTTGSSITTAPGVHMLDAHDLELIRQYYVEILGPINAWKARDIELSIHAGMDASAILDAIEQTAMARRPSHYYLRAILRRYMSEGITTAEKAAQCREERRKERECANREKWSSWYASPEDQMPW